MAEAFLNTCAADCFEAYSAGLGACQGVHPLAVLVMAERGIDISGQRSKSLLEYAGRLDFAYLIRLCDPAELTCPAFSRAGARLLWPFPDPVEFSGNQALRLAKFRALRDGIEARLCAWLEPTDGSLPGDSLTMALASGARERG
jgi:arsenate reductase